MASTRVLVVEDEADLVATYERLLRRHGYQVVSARSREAGLAALKEEPPHLLIADLRLPDGDGLDVVRAARALPTPTPIIVVSGFASNDSRDCRPRRRGVGGARQAVLHGCLHEAHPGRPPAGGLLMGDGLSHQAEEQAQHPERHPDQHDAHDVQHRAGADRSGRARARSR